MWHVRKLPGHIYGVIQNNSYDRSERIDVWLSKHKINNYVIIDEESRRAIVLLNYNC